MVGDGEGTVGVGYGKAKEVPAAIAKGVEIAKKNFFHVPMIRRTIPHVVQGEDAAGDVVHDGFEPRFLFDEEALYAVVGFPRFF